MPITYLPFSTTEPRPTPPSDYQQIPTNPREFGAGVAQGLQTLGAGTTHAGQVFGEIASDDQANQVLTGLDDINAKFRALQGKDRMDAYPQMRQAQQDLLTRARGNLTTIGQTVDFDRQTRYLASRAQREMGDLYDQSMKEWGIGVNKTGAEHSLNQGSQAVLGGDADAVANHQQDFINFRIKEAQMRYGADLAPEIRDNVVATAKADYTESQIRTLMVTPGREGEAQSMLDNNRSLFSGTPRYDALSNAVKAHAFKGQVDGLVSGAISGHMPGRVAPGEKGAVTPQQVSEAAVRNNYDPVAANVAASIESNHGAAAVNTVAPSYQGVFQMGPQERASVGGSATDVGSLADQVDQGTKLLAQRKTELASAIGREPTGFEVWLAHNQGVSGATKLLGNPNTPAGQLVPAINISNNGGDPTAPASQFIGKWRQEYAKREAQFAGQAGTAMQGRQAATDLGAQGGLVPSGDVTPAYRSPGLTAALDRIEASGAPPEAKELAAQRVERHFRDQEIEQDRYDAQVRRAQKDASDARANQIVTAMADPTQNVTVSDIRADPSLEWQTKEHLIGALAAHPGGDPAAAAQAYGPGFWDAYKGVTASADDPNKISDPNAILRRAGPGGDLTLAGAEKLSGLVTKVGKPEHLGDAKIQAGAMAYAKHQLSFEADYGTFKVRDPKGEDAFNIGFTPAFFKYWEGGVAAGKTPQEMADKGEIDKLVQPFKRTPADEMRDKLEAGEETKPEALKIPTADDLAKMGPQELVAAVRTHPALRSQAEALALKNGWIRATPAPPIGGQPGAAPLPP